MQNDLSLVPEDTLIEELGKRFDHWMFAGVKVQDVYTGEKGQVSPMKTMRRWQGNTHTCIGLAFLGITAIERDFQERMDRPDE